MQDKKALITGVANDKSIAWNIAKHLNQKGVETVLTCQSEKHLKRAQKLASSIGAEIIICDFCKENSKEYEPLKLVITARRKKEYPAVPLKVKSDDFTSKRMGAPGKGWEIAEEKKRRRGKHENLHFSHGDCLDIPLPDKSADAATIAFGLRNFEDRAKGLRDISVRPCVHALRAEDPMTMHVPATLAAMAENGPCLL